MELSKAVQVALITRRVASEYRLEGSEFGRLGTRMSEPGIERLEAQAPEALTLAAPDLKSTSGGKAESSDQPAEFGRSQVQKADLAAQARALPDDFDVLLREGVRRSAAWRRRTFIPTDRELATVQTIKVEGLAFSVEVEVADVVEVRAKLRRDPCTGPREVVRKCVGHHEAATKSELAEQGTCRAGASERASSERIMAEGRWQDAGAPHTP